MNGLGDAIESFVIMCIIVAACVGALLMWGIPKLWELIRPLVHAATA